MIEHFAHPEWLGSLTATAIFACAAVVAARSVALRRRRRLGATALIPGGLRTSDATLLVALLAIGLALAGPRIGERSVRVPSGGVDVVFLVDVSHSMDARDVPPSRLDRARAMAAERLARLEPQDRAALAVFAGRGVLLTPLTPDRAALAELISALDTDLIHPASSDLAAGLRASLDAFDAGSERARVVFVLADGEDPLGRRDRAIGELLRAEARVLTAALGTDAGGAIPDHGALLRDSSGSVVISRRRVGRLEEVAAATGGESFRADAWGQIDVDLAAAALRRDAGRSPGEPVVRRVRAVQVAPFAALAFALLLVEGLPRDWRRSRVSRAVAAQVPLLLLGAGPALAPPDARTWVAVGLAHTASGETDAAARAFTAAAITARDPALASLAYFDLGVNALERGELDDARNAFFDALALDPGDRRARYNLEWTLRALAAQQPGPPPNERPPQQRRPDPAEPEPQTAEPEPRDGKGEVESPAERKPPETPSPEQRRRWLERAEDDPGRSMRVTAREAQRRRPAGPVW